MSGTFTDIPDRRGNPKKTHCIFLPNKKTRVKSPGLFPAKRSYCALTMQSTGQAATQRGESK